MPRLPDTPISDVEATGASPGRFDIAASPAAFGAASAQALGGVADAIGTAGDVAAKHAIAYQGLQNETDARSNDIGFSQALAGLQSEFSTKLGKDAAANYGDYAGKARALYDQFRGNLDNPQAQSLFDQVAVRRVENAQENMSSHAAVENKKYMIGTGEARIANEVNLGALAPEPQFQQSLGTIAAEAQQRGEMLGDSAEKIQADTTHYLSEAWTARIRSVMAHDPDGARVLYDQNRGSIDAAHSAMLDQQIESHQYTSMMRQIATEQRNMALADKQKREGQDANFGTLAADVLQGKPIDTNQAADMLRTQQLRPEQYRFLNSEMGSVNKGTDDYAALLPLQAGVSSGTATVDDVIAARDAGHITGPTADKLIKTAVARGTTENTALIHGAMTQLRTALGFDATEKPIIDLGGEAKARQIQLYAQAVGEFNDRTLVKHESPDAVLADLIPRYQSASASVPVWLPAPRLGAISSPDQVQSVWEQTRAAAERGEISQDALQSEAALIKRYSDFYDLQAKKRAALTPKGPAPGPKPGGARSLGVQPAGDPPL